MKGQLFSLDIIAAGLAFILLILGVYLFLVGFQGGVDKFSIYATRLNEIIFSEDPYYGIYKEGKVLYTDEEMIRNGLEALLSSEEIQEYKEEGYKTSFEIKFDPPVDNGDPTDGEPLDIYGSCDHAVKKVTFHRYAIDENGVGHKITLTVCLVPEE